MEQINLLLERLDTMSIATLCVGFVVGALVTALVKRGGKQPVAEGAEGPASYSDDTQWLLRKQDLSGSQRQILEFVESGKQTPIQSVQDRFAKVPDRELFYRLEQLHLLGFIDKERKADQVVYSLSESYSRAVQVPEDDKTVLIPRE